MWTTYDANGLAIASVPYGYSYLSRTYIQQGTTTYTVPTGTRMIAVECVGAGGGSGGVANAATNAAAAGGGGGGAYSMLIIRSPKLTAYTVSVGTGGVAGTAGANTGSVGGDTTFDSPSVCTAQGGRGGLGDTITTLHIGGLGGAGGAASSGVGDLKIDGMPGGTGITVAAAQCTSGAGGNSQYGAGGIAKKNATGVGTAGQLYGGGASGATAISGGASTAGAAGANGVIIVTEFA